MKRIINTYSTGRNVVLMLLAANTVYLVMLLVIIPGVMAYSGGMKRDPDHWAGSFDNQIFQTSFL